VALHPVRQISALAHVEQEQMAVCGEIIHHLVQTPALAEHVIPALAAM